MSTNHFERWLTDLPALFCPIPIRTMSGWDLPFLCHRDLDFAQRSVRDFQIPDKIVGSAKIYGGAVALFLEGKLTETHRQDIANGRRWLEDGSESRTRDVAERGFYARHFRVW